MSGSQAHPAPEPRPELPEVLFIIFATWCGLAMVAATVLIPLELVGFWSGYPSPTLRAAYFVVMAGTGGYQFGRYYRR
jgi:hypothetical protein